MKDGVIADFKVTEKMLNYFIRKAHNRKMLVHSRIVIGVPGEITQVEKRSGAIARRGEPFPQMGDLRERVLLARAQELYKDKEYDPVTGAKNARRFLV
jgi:hypothetical protein